MAEVPTTNSPYFYEQAERKLAQLRIYALGKSNPDHLHLIAAIEQGNRWVVNIIYKPLPDTILWLGDQLWQQKIIANDTSS